MIRKWREGMKTVSPGKLVWRKHYFFFFFKTSCVPLSLYVHTNCWSVRLIGRWLCTGVQALHKIVSCRGFAFVPVLCRSMKQISNPTLFAAWTRASRRPFCLYYVVKMHGKYYSTCSAREVLTRILPYYVLPGTRIAMFRKANRRPQVHTVFHMSDELSSCTTIHEPPSPVSGLSTYVRTFQIHSLVGPRTQPVALCII